MVIVVRCHYFLFNKSRCFCFLKTIILPLLVNGLPNSTTSVTYIKTQVHCNRTCFTSLIHWFKCYAQLHVCTFMYVHTAPMHAWNTLFHTVSRNSPNLKLYRFSCICRSMKLLLFVWQTCPYRNKFKYKIRTYFCNFVQINYVFYWRLIDTLLELHRLVIYININIRYCIEIVIIICKTKMYSNYW